MFSLETVLDTKQPSSEERVRLDVTVIAKMVRRALKQSFKDVKFSVRTSRYSMGSSVDVSWTDGPTSSQVNKVLDVYSDTNGTRVDDSPIYRSNLLDGKPVRFGSYVMGQRDYSDSFVARTNHVLKLMASLSPREKASFLNNLTSHQRDYPHTAISLCPTSPSDELNRVSVKAD